MTTLVELDVPVEPEPPASSPTGDRREPLSAEALAAIDDALGHVRAPAVDPQMWTTPVSPSPPTRVVTAETWPVASPPAPPDHAPHVPGPGSVGRPAMIQITSAMLLGSLAGSILGWVTVTIGMP